MKGEGGYELCEVIFIAFLVKEKNLWQLLDVKKTLNFYQSGNISLKNIVSLNKSEWLNSGDTA